MKFKLIHYSPLEKEIMALFKTNLTQPEIATYFNVCPAMVSYHLKKLEVSNA